MFSVDFNFILLLGILTEANFFLFIFSKYERIIKILKAFQLRISLLYVAGGST